MGVGSRFRGDDAAPTQERSASPADAPKHADDRYDREGSAAPRARPNRGARARLLRVARARRNPHSPPYPCAYSYSGPYRDARAGAYPHAHARAYPCSRAYRNARAYPYPRPYPYANRRARADRNLYSRPYPRADANFRSYADAHSRLRSGRRRSGGLHV